MDILFVLIPMSVVLVFAVIGIFAWALHRGQFDDLDREGERILVNDDDSGFPGSGNVDSDQARK
ncbi:MAG: cbb3-type cytochrome oxidase assembly protein CcoS [Piscinibacter sp.]|uniref:cbb3-type cytochrome oxidase assembly protein CcoS n=1 Tax=Piscinibacter sp. TaxID=1903157 RepID=UPI003D0DAD66